MVIDVDERYGDSLAMSLCAPTNPLWQRARSSGIERWHWRGTLHRTYGCELGSLRRETIPTMRK
jgi:hypothetical protein